jgi:pyrroloquinoline quinone biosynthesis protein B
LDKQDPNSPYFVILGVAQDAGYPQTGCNKECCTKVWKNPSLKRFATSLALIDPASKKWWLFEATPDIKEQLQLFQSLTDSVYNFLPDGIFLTHGHIGHYTGLMQFGREVMNTSKLSVYAMPRMKNYLTENGPWSQLVSLENILLQELVAGTATPLTDNISVSPFLVPHRDEFTETVGFGIQTGNLKTIFIPDIDKWNKFEMDISTIVNQSNLALLDGTFYRDGEIPGRAMNEIPHPFIEESILQFDSLTAVDKKKIRFIHFNHTNPLLNETSDEFSKIASMGFMIAKQGELIPLNVNK